MKRLAFWTIAVAGILAVGGTFALVGERRHTIPAVLTNDRSSAPHQATRTEEFREFTIPAGTKLLVSLDDAVGSATSRVDDRVRAHVKRAVVVDGITAIAEGSDVFGAVTAAAGSARVRGRARIAIRFDTLTPRGGPETYIIRTATITRTAPRTKKKDFLKIALPAAGGAVLGGALGGKKGALIGGAAGGGAGTALAVSSRGPEVRVNGGTALSIRLRDPLTVRARMPMLGRSGRVSGEPAEAVGRP